MSEASSATSVSSGSQTSQANQTSQSSDSSQAQAVSEQGNPQVSAKTAQKTHEASPDDFEEVKIGSVSGKVPKQIAEALKQLNKGFQSKAQEAANTKKLLTLAQNNPKEFYRATGKDPYEFAEELLAEKYELMNMNPEQRRLKELEQWKAEREQQENSSKQEVLEALKEFGPLPKGAENATREQLVRYYQQQKQVYQQEWSNIDTDLGAAFKESGLAPDKHLVAKVAFEMSSALKRGKSLSAKDAMAKVMDEYYSGAKLTFGKMDAKRIHEILGDEFLDKIRKYDLDQVTANAASRIGKQSQGPGYQPASQNSNQKKVLNQFEWRKAMGIE